MLKVEELCRDEMREEFVFLDFTTNSGIRIANMPNNAEHVSAGRTRVAQDRKEDTTILL